jgi:hypothetical protein
VIQNNLIYPYKQVLKLMKINNHSYSPLQIDHIQEIIIISIIIIIKLMHHKGLVCMNKLLCKNNKFMIIVKYSTPLNQGNN